MPDIKEKLVELLSQVQNCGVLQGDHVLHVTHPSNETVANHLIANGVTIQKWISVEEGLPTKEDADGNECVLAVHKVYGGVRCWLWDSIVNCPEQFLYWMRTPEPPKGE